MEVGAAITWEGLGDALPSQKYKICVRASMWWEPSEKEIKGRGDFADGNEKLQRASLEGLEDQGWVGFGLDCWMYWDSKCLGNAGRPWGLRLPVIISVGEIWHINKRDLVRSLFPTFPVWSQAYFSQILYPFNLKPSTHQYTCWFKLVLLHSMALSLLSPASSRKFPHVLTKSGFISPHITIIA